jgi:uncharacterized membrane protein YidH (DUF202 family)
MPFPDEDQPGLARERTDLAWQRLALSFCALAAVLLGVAAHRDAPGLLVGVAALLAVGGAAQRQGRRAYLRDEVEAQPGALALLAVLTALTAVAAAVTVALHL